MNAGEVTVNKGDCRRLAANTIFIKAGDRPSKPAIEGLDSVPTLDSTSIMELEVVPEHLLILGGGYVGLEFGQMFRRFGSQVTIVQQGARLLTREDEDVADEVAIILREDGIEVLLETSTLRAAPAADGHIELIVRTPAGEQTLTATHSLVATCTL